MKNRETLFVLTLLLGIISCGSIENKTKNKIVKVSYSRFGGKSQTITELEVTEDSIVYKTGKLDARKIYKDKTPKELWKELSEVKLKEFDKIESTQSMAKVDGKDEKVSIITKTKVHSFLNGKIVNSTEVKHLLALLHMTMSKMTPQPVL